MCGCLSVCGPHVCSAQGGQTGEEGEHLEDEKLAKKEPENRVVKEGFLEEEDLNRGVERSQTWISRREGRGLSKFQEVPSGLL